MRNFFLPSGKDENGNIPGIYNYCNRLCEHCNFTTMCLSYKMVPSIINAHNLDGTTNDLESILQPADLLLNHAEREYDDQTDELCDDSLTEIKNQLDDSHKIISEYEIIKKAREYLDCVREVFDSLDESSEDPGQSGRGTGTEWKCGGRRP